MADPFAPIRRLVKTPSDAVRWASVLEVTAPKAGNVYPGASFRDLSFIDFVAAADIASKHLRDEQERFSRRIYGAVEETRELTKTNVNLGILLLLGPLVAADELMMRVGNNKCKANDWLEATRIVLDSLDGEDGQNVFRAIQVAGAGGLGEVESMDIAAMYGEVDLIEAMTLAKDRDRIANQYATGFSDLIDNVLPVVWHSIDQTGDLLEGIGRAHIQLLRDEVDSLIARKNGMEVAKSIQRRAARVNLGDPDSVQKFDQSLRGDTHELNPGTTADLVAASLYLLLRTPIF
ncbi:MAG: triphosphoribosyl-dephospho-CoA synthase [Planctomycetota bacterium]